MAAMKTLSLPGTFGGDCTPRGSWCALYPEDRPDPRIQTHLGRVEIHGTGTPNQNVLTLVCMDLTDANGVDWFIFAGAGHKDDRAWLWNGERWIDVCDTYAPSPCAFGPYGLYVSTPGTVHNVKIFDPRSGVQTGAYTKPIGAAGIASVDGVTVENVHPQDQWRNDFGLVEYVLAGGYPIGQSRAAHEGLEVAEYGMLIPDGLCQFNRVHLNQFATSSWQRDWIDPDTNQKARTVFCWPTLADLAGLPKE